MSFATVYLIGALACYASMLRKPPDEALGRFACGLALANFYKYVAPEGEAAGWGVVLALVSVILGLYALGLAHALTLLRRRGAA